MSHGKDTAYVEERLRAIDRDLTFKLGALAQQLKRDFTDIRTRLDGLERRVQHLEQNTVRDSDLAAMLEKSTQVN